MVAKNSEKNKRSILYIDDETALLDIGKIYIERSGGYSVTTAEGADEGISLLKQTSFDCIISDYQMPGMDGIEFLKFLRGEGNNTPFIIFTGKGREEIVIEAINNGADSYVQKGGEPKSQFTELLNTVGRLISAKNAEDELIKSEEKYRALVEYSPNFIYSYDQDNRFKSANRSLCKFLGLSEEEVVGKKYEELGFPEDAYSSLYKLHDMIYETCDIVRSECSLKMPDGNTYHYKVVFIPIFDKNGHVTGIRGNSADITDKVNAERDLIEKNESLLLLNEGLSAAEEELRQQMDEIATAQHSLIETNQYMENLFNNSASLVLVWDDSFRITKANDAVSEITGISAGSLNGFLLDEIISVGKKNELAEKMGSLDAGEHIRGFETQIKDPSGKIRTVSWDVAKIYDYSGKHIATTAQGQEITKILEYQNRLQIKNERLLLANEEITAAEEELRQQMDEIATAHSIIRKSERRMSDIINLLPDPTFAIDRHGDIIVWNAAMSDVYGYSAEEMTGKGNQEYSKIIYGYNRPALVDLILNYDEKFIKENYESTSLRDGKLEGHVTLKNPEGENKTLWGVATLLYNESGEIDGAIETFRDITEIENSKREINIRNEELSAAEEEIRQQFDEIATFQHSLTETNQYMENLFSNSAAPIIVWDNSFRIIKANYAFEKLSGITEVKLKKMLLDEIISPEKKKALLVKMDETARGEHITGFEITVKSISGESRTIMWDMAQIFDYSGKQISTIAQGYDITEIQEYQSRILKKSKALVQKNKELATIQNELFQANHQLKLLTGLTRHDVLNSILAAESYLEMIESSNEYERNDYLNKISEIVVKVRKQMEFTKKSEEFGSDISAWQNIFEIFNDLDVRPGVDLSFSGDGVEILADDMLKKVFENLLDNTLRHGGESLSVIQADCSISPDNMLQIIWQDNGRGVSDEEKEKIFEEGYGNNSGLGLSYVRELLEMSGITIRESGLSGEGARFVISVPPGRYRLNGL